MQILKGIIIGSLIPYLIMIISGEVLSLVVKNVYIHDFFFYILPVVTTAFLFFYFLKRNRKVATGIAIGFIVYYPIFWFVFLWGAGDATCTRYFFNLFTNCL